MSKLSKNFSAFAKPFIDSSKNIFETMVYTKISPGQPVLKQEKVSTGDITAIIGIAGEHTQDDKTNEYQGMLALSWPEETYIKVASAMLMEEYKEYGDEIADVGGEIINMIMGNAKRDLVGIGYTTSMAVPSMIRGKDHQIKYLPQADIIMIPISTDHGEFFMDICYKDI